MEKLLNDQMLNMDVNTKERTNDVLVANTLTEDKECEIEKGNLKDYLEVFGDLEDI